MRHHSTKSHEPRAKPPSTISGVLFYLFFPIFPSSDHRKEAEKKRESRPKNNQDAWWILVTNWEMDHVTSRLVSTKYNSMLFEGLCLFELVWELIMWWPFRIVRNDQLRLFILPNYSCMNCTWMRYLAVTYQHSLDRLVHLYLDRNPDENKAFILYFCMTTFQQLYFFDL